MKHRRRHVPWLTPLLLAALLTVNIVPLLLVVRQALTPAAEAARWPLPLWPGELTFENIRALWGSQRLLRHAGLSVWVATATTLISLGVGFPAGWAAARWSALATVATRCALASRILPPIAMAIPITSLLIPAGLYNQPAGLGLVVAHLTLGLPISILLAFAAFREVPVALEEAAAVDGCGPLVGFVRVALPSVAGAIGGASILIFLLSWDEFAYALLIQLTHRTLPPLIYYYTEYGELGIASSLAVLMLVPALAVVASLQRMIARGAMTGGVNE